MKTWSEHMNLNHLGDAIDHWKGSLFEYLQAEDALHEFAVDPMATDSEKWNEDDFLLFVRLLRIKRRQIITHKACLKARAEYFAEIRHGGDIFLDADTGIATSHSSAMEKYVTPEELADLLRRYDGRTLAVYQHVRAQRTCARVDQCVATVAKRLSGIKWCSYESPTVAMLFFSIDGTRTSQIATALNQLLGKHAERLVRAGNR